MDTGLPAIRHVWLHHPDSATADRDDQFLLGGSLLVAPVLEPGVTEVEVTFPPGRWVHLPTGEEFRRAQTRTVSAPIGVPAAFVEAGHPMAGDMVNAVRTALAS